MEKYTLIGSTTSPYVRRLRILLSQTDYQFKNLMVFDPKQREELRQLTPVLKIPILQIDEGDKKQIIYDSRVIFNYLHKKFGGASLSIEDENLLTVIDGINDSFVILYSMVAAGMTLEEDKRFIKAQRERVSEGFGHLNSLWAVDRAWDYPAISLYCLLDWALFREQVDIDQWPKLKSFWLANQHHTSVKTSDPRH